MEREREEEEEKEKKEEGVVTTVPSQAVVTFTLPVHTRQQTDFMVRTGLELTTSSGRSLHKAE